MGSKIPYIPETTRVFLALMTTWTLLYLFQAPLCLRCGCSWWSSVRMLSSDSFEHLGKITAKRSPNLYIFTVHCSNYVVSTQSKNMIVQHGFIFLQIRCENKEIFELPCHRATWFFGGPRFERKNTFVNHNSWSLHLYPPQKRKEPSHKTMPKVPFKASQKPQKRTQHGIFRQQKSWQLFTSCVQICVGRVSLSSENRFGLCKRKLAPSTTAISI